MVRVNCSQIAQDLRDEQQSLDEIVTGLDNLQWALPTSSVPWTVADQIGHLTYFDNAASLAITNPTAFAEDVNRFWTATPDGGTVDDLSLRKYRALAPAQLLDGWRASRRLLSEAAATLTDDARVNWYGPSMGAKSFLTARLMETWAHGQDVVDAVGVPRVASDRLSHIARLGFITRSWSYTNRSLEVPIDPIRVNLTSPAGEGWSYGPDDPTESVIGPAADFCLVVTQRRHVDDTQLVATRLGREWLLIAQAFAGPPTDGPPAGTRSGQITHG